MPRRNFVHWLVWLYFRQHYWITSKRQRKTWKLVWRSPIWINLNRKWRIRWHWLNEWWWSWFYWLERRFRWQQRRPKENKPFISSFKFFKEKVKWRKKHRSEGRENNRNINIAGWRYFYIKNAIKKEINSLSPEKIQEKLQKNRRSKVSRMIDDRQLNNW